MRWIKLFCLFWLPSGRGKCTFNVQDFYNKISRFHKEVLVEQQLWGKWDRHVCVLLELTFHLRKPYPHFDKAPKFVRKLHQCSEDGLLFYRPGICSRDTREVLHPPCSSSHHVCVVSCGFRVWRSRGQHWVLECLCSLLLLTPISVVLCFSLLEEYPESNLEDRKGKNSES